MTALATYSRSGPIGTIVMDDGKANVMSLNMLNALHAAFDQAEKDKTVAILKARGKHFSGGFDLNVFAKGSAEEQYLMVKAGAELALRILSFPTPVVAACQGNAFPMGAFLIMASDHRIAAEGNYRIGMNEVAIGLTVGPRAQHAQHGGACRDQGAGAGRCHQDDSRHDRQGHHPAIWRRPGGQPRVGLRVGSRQWRSGRWLCMKAHDAKTAPGHLPPWQFASCSPQGRLWSGG